MLDHIFYSFSYRGLQATSYVQVYDVARHGNFQFIPNYQFIRQFGLRQPWYFAQWPQVSLVIVIVELTSSTLAILIAA